MRSWVAATWVWLISPSSPSVLSQVMSQWAVAVSEYLQSLSLLEVFVYRCPQSGESLTPTDFAYGVPGPLQRTILPSPIVQSIAVTCALAVTVNPGTLAERSIGP